MELNTELLNKMKLSIEALNTAGAEQEKDLDELYPAKKGTAKTTTLIAKLEKIKEDISKGVKVEDIPKIVDEVEKAAATLKERIDDREGAPKEDSVDHKSVVAEGHKHISDYINEKLRRFG